MPAAHIALNSYQQTHIRSRTPLELVVMLYDGALQSLTIARDAIERRSIPARHAAISRALGIISELQNTLDLEAGGALAASLDELYGYSSRRLLDASMHNDVRPVDEVRRLLGTLREGWQTIATQPPGTAA